jgi:hypothetical protein
MITLTGKYNSANIFIDDIEEETKKQIYGFLIGDFVRNE